MLETLDRPRAAQMVDRLGRPYTSMMDSALRRGRRPPNYGRRFPAEVLTSDECRRLLAACSRRGAAGLRNRAMIVLMWRCGLRIAETIALELRDLDAGAGTITVRHGKGDQRRVVGIDAQALAVVEQWLQRRSRLPGLPRRAPLFCTITTGNVGHPVGAPYLREALKRLAWRAGIQKRVHPHGLRHTHAVELLREGVPVTMIQRQLGHSSLETTARYLDHLMPQEVVDRVRLRTWDPPARPSVGGVLPGQTTIDDMLSAGH